VIFNSSRSPCGCWRGMRQTPHAIPPSASQGWFRKGQALFELKKYEEAHEAFSKVVTRDRSQLLIAFARRIHLSQSLTSRRKLTRLSVCGRRIFQRFAERRLRCCSLTARHCAGRSRESRGQFILQRGPDSKGCRGIHSVRVHVSARIECIDAARSGIDAATENEKELKAALYNNRAHCWVQL
jgi:hypothetical protein